MCHTEVYKEVYLFWVGATEMKKLNVCYISFSTFDAMHMFTLIEKRKEVQRENQNHDNTKLCPWRSKVDLHPSHRWYTAYPGDGPTVQLWDNKELTEAISTEASYRPCARSEARRSGVHQCRRACRPRCDTQASRLWSHCRIATGCCCTVSCCLWGDNISRLTLSRSRNGWSGSRLHLEVHEGRIEDDG